MKKLADPRRNPTQAFRKVVKWVEIVEYYYAWKIAIWQSPVVDVDESLNGSGVNMTNAPLELLSGQVADLERSQAARSKKAGQRTISQLIKQAFSREGSFRSRLGTRGKVIARVEDVKETKVTEKRAPTRWLLLFCGRSGQRADFRPKPENPADCCVLMLPRKLSASLISQIEAARTP